MRALKIIFNIIILNLISSISTKILSLIQNVHFSKKIRKLESKNFITNIYYSEKDNNYYIKLYLGKDSLPQSYFLDTTFPIISSPCNLCESCDKHLFPFFNIEAQNDIINCNSSQCSSTITINSCKEEKCYFNMEHNLDSNKNIEGFLVNSKIFFNNSINSLSLIMNITMGCTTKEGDFYKNKEINGVFGISNNRNSFIDKIYESNIIQNNLFTICLTKKGGFLSLGEIIINSYENGNINYIPIIPSSSNNLFELKINYIQINEQKINQVYISYIDSSSKFSYFPKKIYDEIIKNFLYDIFKKENKANLFKLDEEYGYCRIFNNKEEKEDIIFRIYPNIIINFGGFNYEWKPQNYLIEYKTEEQNEIKACFGFKESIKNDNNIILGINIMVNHEIIFDKTNQKIAFINSDCDELIEYNDIKSDGEKINENNVNNTINLTDKINQNYNNINISFINESIINEDFKNNNNSLIINQSILNENKVSQENITSKSTIYKNSILNNKNNSDLITNINNSIITISNNITINTSIMNTIRNSLIETIYKDSNYSYLSNILNNTINSINNIKNNTIVETINSLPYNNTILNNFNNITDNTINLTGGVIIDNISDNIIDFITDNATDNNKYNFTDNSNNIISYNIIHNFTKNTISDNISSTIKNLTNSTLLETIKSYFENKNEINYLKNITSTLIKKTFINTINIRTTQIIGEKGNINIHNQKLNSTIINRGNNIITEIIYDNLNKSIKSSDKIQKNEFNEKSNEESSKKNIINNKENNEENKGGENEYLKDKSIVNSIFRMIKSFIKNKLIYFLLALIGIIACFFIVILISCAIISCIKMFKRRNYMVQMDIEVPKESKYNTGDLSSASD